MFKIRASQCGKIMASPDKSAVPVGAKTYLKEWLIESKYGRRKEISSKYLEKGNICEDDGIKLLSAVYDLGFLVKHDGRKENDFATGEPDVLIDAKTGEDIKCSWDLHTFPMFETKLPNKDYFWQCQVYMWLFERELWNVSYCLIDTPEHLIFREYNFEINRLTKGGNNLSSQEEEEIEWEVRKNHTFSDIPLEDRIRRFPVERDDKAIEQIKSRVEACREYIKEME